MKKLIVLALLLAGNMSIAYIYMSKDLLQSSLTLNREQWANKCSAERLKMYSGLYGCKNPNSCPYIMYELKKHCWYQYDIARRDAYLRKN